MNHTFRRYHRQISVMMCIPLALTIITGIAYPILAEWFAFSDMAGLMLQIHSGRILGLESIYPVLNGLGLAGLLITGLSMTRLFRQKRLPNQDLGNEVRNPEELIKR
ncbi:MAG: peptidase [Leptolyngbyaceae cyanobacterium CRU_2_3]|nr:peptidase [Leptolyngbyaceae cyanobacterium CRU_2_3]